MEPTDNHELQVWEHGDRPWSHNEDMETIEAKLVVRDTAGSRSEYTPHEDALYLATDTGDIYSGTGSGWTKIGAMLRYASGEHIVDGELEVQGLVDVKGQVRVPNSEGGYAAIRPSQNNPTGVSVRPNSNPANGDAIFTVESVGSATRLYVAHNGESYFGGHLRVTRDFTVEGSKNFAHPTGGDKEIVYTAQESAAARAVYEGQATVSRTARTRIQLPAHFTTVVSSSDPQLRVQVTPHDSVHVAVTDRSPASIEVEVTSLDTDSAPDEVTLDYRVTGVRGGCEEKEIVRKKPKRPGRGSTPAAGPASDSASGSTSDGAGGADTDTTTD